LRAVYAKSYVRQIHVSSESRLTKDLK
jgi:hypothetical protein